LIVLTE
jgi:hypothetical protein